ncbi:hypothetical protein H3146_19900 [Streptomyces sp. OF3]|uniref:Lipoprotein n=1 Tax=Streptomyces alkaliterrae TaxID=2213162 RepID=A0A7W3WPA0_9ACTN|nr:hypothetical protein [Streptomyces alkaliterrae]MBB1255600.1 hypothetical protein [Streptomyces alkaliterrae]
MRRHRHSGPTALMTAASGAVLLAVAATAGCGGDRNDDDARPTASPTTAPTTTSATPTLTAEPSPPYPTGPDGCHENRGWKPEKAAGWLRLRFRGPQNTAAGDPEKVQLTKAVEGYSGPLCRPLTVQVEFWRLVHGMPDRSAGRPSDATGPDPDYYFSAESVSRVELRVDGGKEHHVPLPKSLYGADARDACTGALLAVYAGPPLRATEMPEEITLSDASVWRRGAAGFRTKRVADYEVVPPSAPRVCGPDGTPTAEPPTPGATGVPRPGIPLHPTPSRSFDPLDRKPTTVP